MSPIANISGSIINGTRVNGIPKHTRNIPNKPAPIRCPAGKSISEASFPIEAHVLVYPKKNPAGMNSRLRIQRTFLVRHCNAKFRELHIG